MHETDLKFFTEISEENLVTFKRAPRVRVKMVEQQESLDFDVKGRFVVSDEQGTILTDEFEADGTSRAQVDAFTPPTYQFLLFVIEVFHLEKAKSIVDDLKKKGFSAWYKTFGYRVQLGVVEEKFDLFRYRVYIGPLPNKRKARHIQTRLLGVFSAQIRKITNRQTRGILEIVDLQNKNSLKGTGFIRLKPKSSGGSVTIHNIQNLNSRMSYTFNHSIEFQVADNGKLYLIGEMDIEEYIVGLMTALYKPDHPIEFLKAMAICYRSSILANLGMSHINEPFDFNRSEPNFEFAWKDTLPTKLKTVLEQTAGNYLVKDERICDTRHTMVCGGHTEHIDIILNRDTRNSITGRFDQSDNNNDFPVNLSNEIDSENWIQSRPEVLCNLRGREFEPNFKDHNSHFRWIVEYSRQELEEIIKKKTGEDIGIIYDIVPLLRGGSGRLLELEVLCSHRNVHLVGDLEIRYSLSEDILPSSCFVIETKPGVDGMTAQFSFIGAGVGHGVGLCQAGAITMAFDDKNYLEILKHYFGHFELESSWPMAKIN